ncbi:hypothetical protein NIES22_66240 [Calothrix brevissima NIES-22]|nr:hypothetical protein NIES22_66240 [Calothrix brevissima NIES-22]
MDFRVLYKSPKGAEGFTYPHNITVLQVPENINGYFDPGKLVAFPADVNKEILARFGAAPANKDTNKDGQYNEAVDWTQQVLKDYVIPELKPDVIFNWLTEPEVK